MKRLQRWWLLSYKRHPSSYQWFSDQPVGSFTVSALHLCVPPSSARSQPQAAPVDDGGFLLVHCFLGIGWFGFLLPVGFGGVIVSWCDSVTQKPSAVIFSFTQWLLHLSTVRQPSNSGSPCIEDTGLFGAEVLAYSFMCVHPGIHVYTRMMWGRDRAVA